MGQEVRPGGLRVLIVDNAAYARARLRKILEDHRYQVVGEASNSTEAVACYKRERPDLVTLDLVMTGEHGFQVFSKLKKFDPGVRVVIVSAMVDHDTIERAELLGVKGYVTKPEDWPQFEKVLKQAMVRQEEEHGRSV